MGVGAFAATVGAQLSEQSRPAHFKRRLQRRVWRIFPVLRFHRARARDQIVVVFVPLSMVRRVHRWCCIFSSCTSHSTSALRKDTRPRTRPRQSALTLLARHTAVIVAFVISQIASRERSLLSR